jgi:adenylate cyclase
MATLKAAFAEQVSQEESRAEIISCLIFGAAMVCLYIGVSIVEAARSMPIFKTLGIACVSYAVVVGVFYLIAKKGLWHWWLSYANTAIQITLLTYFLASVSQQRGPIFALSTALPMAYCLAISLTAFRLKPGLSIFAGLCAAIMMTLVYILVMRPLIDPSLMVGNPTLNWAAVIGRSIVLLMIGLACAFAAGTLRRQLKKRIEDEGRINLLERTFGRLVAPEVAKQILENSDWMRPARRDAVVLFADLKGFTKFSESRSPEEVAGYLNRCWGLAADIVERHGGVINKYMGDGFLALFGVPLEHPHAEQAAAQTANELQEKLAPVLDEAGLELCVGIHNGPMIVGGIGSESRCEFTVIGSTVNLASRLETLNRSLKTNTLTSESVAQKISATWHVQTLGAHPVKGVSSDVEVYELLDKKKKEENP